jgi:hypothetical protein
MGNGSWPISGDPDAWVWHTDPDLAQFTTFREGLADLIADGDTA